MRLLLYSLILIVIAPGVRAQVEMDRTGRIQRLLNQRFSAALLAANPTAVPESIPAGPPAHARQSQYAGWRVDDGSVVSVTSYVARSGEDAQQLLLGMQSTIAVKNVAVQGRDDEAFLISPNRDGVEGLLFRRGPIVLLVRAHGTKNVERFAAIFDGQVQQAIRNGEIDEQ